MTVPTLTKAPRTDDGTLTDDRIVVNDRAHALQHLVLDGAAVQDAGVADVAAEDQRSREVNWLETAPTGPPILTGLPKSARPLDMARDALDAPALTGELHDRGAEIFHRAEKTLRT